MRSRSRPLSTALRSLIVACGTFLLLMMMLQFYPRWGGSVGVGVGLQAGQKKDETDAAQDAATPPEETPRDPFQRASLSGSAIGRTSDDTTTAVVPPYDHPGATFEVDAVRRDESDVPPPPIASEPITPTASPFESQRLHQRLAALERRMTSQEKESAACLSAQPDRTIALLKRLDEQQRELTNTSTRLERLERQVEIAHERLSHGSSGRSHVQESLNPTPRIAIRVIPNPDGGQSHVEVEARDASLPELFARLGETLGINLLVSPEVTGAVSLHLRAPNRDEVLDAICRIHHCRCERTGNIVVVSRIESEERLSFKPQRPETMSKLYRLQHLSGAEIQPYVVPLLTPGVGIVSFATIGERVGRTEYREPPRAILVKDLPNVLADVDRLILELDRPPADGKGLPPVATPLPERSPPPGKSAQQPTLPTPTMQIAPRRCCRDNERCAAPVPRTASGRP
jgi:hypothetical protein